VYQAESARTLVEGRRATGPRGERGLGLGGVSRNVFVLGTVSFLTDVSSEMVAAILPIYLVFALGATPLQYGIVDGLYHGATAVVRLGGGFAADRWRRHKEVAAAGYGLSAVSKAGLVAFAGSLGAVTGVVLADRAGKGIRTAPRDALVALSAAPAALATAFGVHRAMDTAGALLGPLAAFGLLLAAPGRFDAIWVVSLCFAVAGLAVLLLLADGRPRTRADALTAAAGGLAAGRASAAASSPAGTAPPGALPTAGRVAAGVGDGALAERPRAREAALLLARPGFRQLAAIAALLGLATVSDAFVYLGLQRTLDLSLSAFPLLFVGSAAVFMALAVPIGRVADRIGRVRVFVGGYALLLVVYATLLAPPAGLLTLAVALIALGAYYAATDGVLQAIASAALPDRLRATGLAILVTAVSLAKLLSSLAFGAAWTLGGLEAAVAAFAVALVAALACAAWLLTRSEAPA